MSDFAVTYGDEQRKKLDQKEFETFFHLYYGNLCDFAVSYVGNRDVAEDIVQSIFLNIWEQKNIWEDFENAKAYLYKSVRNEALNYKKHEKVIRDARSEVRLRFNEWHTSDKIDSRKISRINAIQDGISQLPDRCREIFKMSREGGLTYNEIAEILGLSIKTVETQIGRALKSIRSFVSEHWEISTFTIFILQGL